MSTPVAAERLDPVPGSPWWSEHRSRYHFAGCFVAGSRVLDIACGTGYGMPLLLDAGANTVVGVDSSAQALQQAKRWHRPGLEFLQGDACELPVGDESFDVTVSFETLEHIGRQERFAAELRRVTRPNGTLILSTPNALHSRTLRDRSPNPFHVRELAPAEVHELLTPYFKEVQLVGQRPHPRFRPCPYWEAPNRLPTSVRGRAAVLLWKVELRFPAHARNRLTQLVHGRPFLPGEHDFTFDPVDVEAGHVIVAVCGG